MTGKVLRHPLVWICLIVIIGTVVVGQLLPVRGQVEQEFADEPIVLPFSHNVHVEKVGVQCLFCHSDALRSPQASLPSIEKCMICHASITVEGEEAQTNITQVVTAFEEYKRVQWPDVYKQPDFVYFSHRPHLAKGVSCQTCHGEVQKMDLVEKTVEMNMGFCLDCHREQVAKTAALAKEVAAADGIEVARTENPHEQAIVMPKLIDCTTCHK